MQLIIKSTFDSIFLNLIFLHPKYHLFVFPLSNEQILKKEKELTIIRKNKCMWLVDFLDRSHIVETCFFVVPLKLTRSKPPLGRGIGATEERESERDFPFYMVTLIIIDLSALLHYCIC